MIDLIKYSENTTAVVFDEMIPEYHDILVQARTDKKNKIRKNYTIDSLSRCYFMTMFLYKDKPHCIFGLEKTKWDKTARAFFRLYIPPLVHKFNDINGKMIGNFYHSHPQYHKKHGIENLFFTRNLGESLFHMQKYKLDDKWIKQETPYMYNYVPQWFWISGSNHFLKSLKQA